MTSARPTRSLALAVVAALALVLPGCGGKGDPLAPIRPTPPVLATAVPGTMVIGTVVDVVVTGSAFSAETRFTVTAAGVELLSVTLDSPTQVTLRLAVAATAPLGAVVITAINPGSTATARALVQVVAVPGPVVTSVGPNRLQPGTSLSQVRVNGANFANGAVVSGPPGDDLVYGPVTFLGSALLVVDVTAPQGARTGPHDVVVTNPDGKSGTGAGMMIVDAVPVLAITSVNPSRGAPGDVGLAVIVGGSNFQPGAAVTFSSSGITVRSQGFVSSGQVNLVIDIAAAAPLGARDVTLTNPDRTTTTARGAFAVSPVPPPSVGSLIPNASAAGKTGVGVALFGASFKSGATVSFSGGGITVVSVGFVSTSRLNLVIDIAAGAALGARDVTVTNPDTMTGTGVGAFAVVATSNPIVSSASPSTGSPNSTGLGVSVIGANFQNGATVSFSGGGITVTSVSFVSAGQLDLRLDITAAATPGARNVTVTNPDTTTGTGTGLFTVAAAPPPSVSSVSPSSGLPGASGLALAVGGGSFQNGATVAFSGAGITVSSVSFTSSTQLDIVVNIAAAAAPGARDVTVTNPDTRTGTGVGVFTVSTPPLSFAGQVQPIFNNSCAFTGGCHAGSPAAGMNLSAGVAWSNIVNAVSTETSPRLRVAPGSTAASYLVEKIESASPTVGGRMPLGGPYLSAADIATLKTWITQGALNN